MVVYIGMYIYCDDVHTICVHVEFVYMCTWLYVGVYIYNDDVHTICVHVYMVDMS